MLTMEEYDYREDIDMGDTQPNEETERGASTVRPLNNQTQIGGISNAKSLFSKNNIDENKNSKTFYMQHFSKEVDFHHKVAYRFEKAYRLGKKMPSKKQTLNLEVIDCIGEHSNYIEQDNMSLFYLLFFCIYYNNADMIDFIKNLIRRNPPVKKIEDLLLYMDTNDIEKIRTVGEQVNSIVYHMVFYQAVDDDLRIVYSSIFRQLRFIQMRDDDALCLLKNRDYELIRQSFDKHITKMPVE